MSTLSALAEKVFHGLAVLQDFEGIKREEIKAIKEDTSAVRYRFVTSEDVVQKAADEGEPQTFKHIASDETTDRVGDVIRVAGWDLKEFQKNPQLLWCHDRNGLPIGLVDKAWKGRKAASEKAGSGGDPALFTKSHLHPADMNEAAPAVERLMAAGALPGVSVGYVSTKSHWPSDEEERKELGLGDMGILYLEQGLVELSVCPVPCNPSALQQRDVSDADMVLSKMLTDGEIRPDLVKELRAMWLMTDVELAKQARSTVTVPEMPTATLPFDTTTNELVFPQATLTTTGNTYYGKEEIESLAALSRATSTLLDKVDRIEKHLDRRDAEAGPGKQAPTPPDAPVEEGATWDELFTEAAKAMAEKGASENG